MHCSLCSSSALFFCEDKKRTYFQCTTCHLIFADPATQLSHRDEKAIYDFHENDAQDSRYRAFLSQLATPLLEKLSPGMSGLDYGCGPGPTLSLMLEEHGMNMSLYDIFYTPDTGQLQRTYDFVSCSEVAEHFSSPHDSWAELTRLLNPGGWLGVMTWLFTKNAIEAFNRWSYKGDPTHVSFYTPQTIQWLATHFQLDCHIVSDQVILLQKTGT